MITPKFKIGDKVYHGSSSHKAIREVCPDCLGKRYWKATLGTGEEILIHCPTCRLSPNYYSEQSAGFIEDRSEISCDVRVLTIGSVRMDTNEKPGRQISYMCEETGVGFGSIYYEESVFDTETDAKSYALAQGKETEKYREEEAAKRIKYRKEDGPGRKVALYRGVIRKAKKELETATKRLEELTKE